MINILLTRPLVQTDVLLSMVLCDHLHTEGPNSNVAISANMIYSKILYLILNSQMVCPLGQPKTHYDVSLNLFQADV